MILWHSDHYRHDCFLCAMVSKTVMFLGQCWVSTRCVFTDRPVVKKDTSWYIENKSKHAHLLAQWLYYLHYILHHSELWSECCCLNWVLRLAEPYHWHIIAKKQYTGLRFSRLSVTRMIHINKTICRNKVSSCNWYITWYRLIKVPLKIFPVTLMEPVFVDGRMFRVKTPLPLWMSLKVSKYMECLLEVPSSGHHGVAR